MRLRSVLLCCSSNSRFYHRCSPEKQKKNKANEVSNVNLVGFRILGIKPRTQRVSELPV